MGLLISGLGCSPLARDVPHELNRFSCDQFVTKAGGIQGYSGVFGNKGSL